MKFKNNNTITRILYQHALFVQTEGRHGEFAIFRYRIDMEDLKEADFRGENLEGIDFEGFDLRKADFRECSLIGVDFEAADLRGADFRGANLKGCLTSSNIKILGNILIIDYINHGSFWEIDSWIDIEEDSLGEALYL